MSKNVKLHIGTPEDMGRRFIDAWRRAERGEQVDETNITFRDLESLLAALTPKRLHLLRYVRHHHVRNIKALASELRRDYKNVHKDVEELTKLGLLFRTPDEVTAPYGEVDADLCFSLTTTLRRIRRRHHRPPSSIRSIGIPSADKITPPGTRRKLPPSYPAGHAFSSGFSVCLGAMGAASISGSSAFKTPASVGVLGVLTDIPLRHGRRIVQAEAAFYCSFRLGACGA